MASWPVRRITTLGADIDRFCDETQVTDGEALNLHYQRIVRASDLQVIGAEALVRWHHAEIGLCPAPEVLRAASLRGRSRDLDELVLDRALDDIAQVLAPVTDPDPYLGVNLTPSLLANPQFLFRLRSHLDRLSLDPSGLVIEVPDRARVLVDPVAAETVSGLQDLGVLVCLDDAGPGGGVLATVRHLDIDAIKISRWLVGGLHVPAIADSIGNLVEKSRRLGTRVIAVGVSSQVDVRQLQLLGCDFLQGNHFGRPVDRHTFVERLSA